MSHICSYSTTAFEAIGIFIHDINTLLFFCYKQPSLSLASLKCHITRAIFPHVTASPFSIMGDFNVPFHSNQYDDLFSWLSHLHPCSQLINTPTTDYNSTLDLAFTNIPHASCTVLESAWSDHKPVTLNIPKRQLNADIP